MGLRVCAVIRDVRSRVFDLVGEAKEMCRKFHMDGTAQLESNSQRLQCLAQELVDGDAQLRRLLESVRSVGCTASRVVEAEAGVRAAKRTLIGELTANARREKQLRDLVRRVRASEASTTELAGAGTSNAAESTSAAASSSSVGAAAPTPPEDGENAGVPLRELLRYARRIGASTSHQPNQPWRVFPLPAQMKDSILHHPERFAVKRQAANLADAAAEAVEAAPAKLPRLDVDGVLGARSAAAAEAAAAANPHDATPVRVACGLCALTTAAARSTPHAHTHASVRSFVALLAKKGVRLPAPRLVPPLWHLTGRSAVVVDQLDSTKCLRRSILLLFFCSFCFPRALLADAESRLSHQDCATERAREECTLTKRFG